MKLPLWLTIFALTVPVISCSGNPLQADLSRDESTTTSNAGGEPSSDTTPSSTESGDSNASHQQTSDDSDTTTGSASDPGEPATSDSGAQADSNGNDVASETGDASTGEAIGSGSGGSVVPLDSGNCCFDEPEGPGCEVPDVEDCVCAFEPFCCNVDWSIDCIAEAANFCGATCLDDECCETHHFGGCRDLAVEQCVCELDSYCCTDRWDNTCVAYATQDCAAGC